jgi:hypothetical protein
MLNRSHLSPVPITRSDGVSTTVWKKDGTSTESKKARLGGVAAPTASSSVPRTGKAIDYALDFDPYNPEPVTEPEWWAGYVNESETAHKKQFQSTPELLDIIPSAKGDLAVVWQPMSQTDRDFGPLEAGHDMRVLYLINADTGEQEGYLKLSSVSNESFARAFGNDEFTPFRYRSKESGARYSYLDLVSGDPYEDDEEDEPIDDIDELRRRVWKTAKLDFHHQEPKELPDDATIRSELKEFAKEIQPDMTQKKRYFKTPFIDFSRVSDDLQGQGFGASMYVYAAKMLATQDLKLRSTFERNQSPQARAMWSRFKEQMPERVGTMSLTRFYDKKNFQTLDFRDRD